MLADGAGEQEELVRVYSGEEKSRGGGVVLSSVWFRELVKIYWEARGVSGIPRSKEGI